MSNIQKCLRKKRFGEALTDEEIDEFVISASTKSIDSSQIGAMLMAIAIQGMTKRETITLTKSIINSGESFKWSGVLCDKHSTGGVGDKVSIPLTPALVANGVRVPMLSGRGLGITGGTLDKLESIPGFRVELSPEEMEKCLDTANAFIAAATERICPGDKILYSIRDVTSTVDCVHLIIASILSKKAAEGTKYLVQDVKVGKSAVCRTIEEARALSKEMCSVSSSLGITTRCVVTSMDTPIGRNIGNSLEVLESIECMKGGGPEDLVELVKFLGGELLWLCGKTGSREEGQRLIEMSLNNGKALEHFHSILLAQGVKLEVADCLCHGDSSALEKARLTTPLTLNKRGNYFVEHLDAYLIGEVCWELGCGRSAPSDPLVYSSGAVLSVSVGSRISGGDVWITIHHEEPLSQNQIDRVNKALTVSVDPIPVPSRILEVVS